MGTPGVFVLGGWVADRAILFVDGNNWYHSLGEAGIARSLSYRAISQKLCGPRLWKGTRYYIGALKSSHSSFAQQRRFLSLLEGEDSRITVHRGRIEDRQERNPLADELMRLLERTPDLDREFVLEATRLVDAHRYTSYMKEKAVDVMLAIDMCYLAYSDEYDAAYLLSADGDFTAAVELVLKTGKKVYVASPGTCYALGQVTTYIHLQPDWFLECMI